MIIPVSFQCSDNFGEKAKRFSRKTLGHEYTAAPRARAPQAPPPRAPTAGERPRARIRGRNLPCDVHHPFQAREGAWPAPPPSPPLPPFAALSS
jgi:hypothetical protein